MSTQDKIIIATTIAFVAALRIGTKAIARGAGKTSRR